ncbi:hypothetical protein HYPSUDRAFT_197107 [Hypholoma sublateritium FD-334 SS-4]|uniref:Uncharacterized protein n=1 Tax=Hypholoma sublateritium (strain FD-334 SS-4) TaxID=945553 RepID=A0A0D2LLY9_HYPSF|nr:hypothetical protein HYPSUDRAFT_197107 [Hypholoma sublateritium FD-334 SS-4]
MTPVAVLHSVRDSTSKWPSWCPMHSAAGAQNSSPEPSTRWASSRRESKHPGPPTTYSATAGALWTRAADARPPTFQIWKLSKSAPAKGAVRGRGARSPLL